MNQRERVGEDTRESKRAGRVAARITFGLWAKALKPLLPQSMQIWFIEEVPCELTQLQARIKHLAQRGNNEHGERPAGKLLEIAHLSQIVHGSLNDPPLPFFLNQEVEEPPVIPAADQRWVSFDPNQLWAGRKSEPAVVAKSVNFIKVRNIFRRHYAGDDDLVFAVWMVRRSLDVRHHSLMDPGLSSIASITPCRVHCLQAHHKVPYRICHLWQETIQRYPVSS